MSAESAGARFLKIYDSLPADAQRVLVEDQLTPLLDLVLKDKAKNVISTAALLRKSFDEMPMLDLKAKNTEINDLFDELSRHTKRSFIRGGSNREEIISEIVDSLCEWLPDIWKVAYEYRIHFQEAHDCLVFAANILDRISTSCGGCNCSILNMFVSVEIKDNSGETIKLFSFSGAYNLVNVLLWIWRDLFVSLLDTKLSRQKNRIPRMLADIEDALSWEMVKNILPGGGITPGDGLDCDGCYEDDDGDEDFEDDNRCTCEMHANHWSDAINNHRLRLRDLVQEFLASMFRATPSFSLYQSIQGISQGSGDGNKLFDDLDKMAFTCSDSFAAAVGIHANEGHLDKLLTLLNTGSYLLRPSDSPTLQLAVLSLSQHPKFAQRALKIIETELMDTSRYVHAALLPSFSCIENEDNKQELLQILKLRNGSPARTSRIDHWVDAVISPGASPANPMLFMAMMMGLPVPPGLSDGDDADPLGFLDLNQDDEDLDDLREEFRPKIKARFESWVDTACELSGGPSLLLAIYRRMVDMMPYLRAHDAVAEMISRLVDKPGKHHVCDALDAVSSFCKLQRRKIAIIAEKKAQKAGQSSTGNASKKLQRALSDRDPRSGISSPFPANGFPFFFGPGSSSSPHQSPSLTDVD